MSIGKIKTTLRGQALLDYIAQWVREHYEETGEVLGGNFDVETRERHGGRWRSRAGEPVSRNVTAAVLRKAGLDNPGRLPPRRNP